MSRYPSEWEADVLLADGGVVHLRPVRPDDGDAVRAMHGRLSAETVENRFFEATARVLDRDLDTVLAAAHDRLVVLVATLGDQVIGVSYDPVEDLLMRLGRLGADLPQVASFQLDVACTAAECVVVRATATVTAAPSEVAPRRLDAQASTADGRQSRMP